MFPEDIIVPEVCYSQDRYLLAVRNFVIFVCNLIVLGIATIVILVVVLSYRIICKRTGEQNPFQDDEQCVKVDDTKNEYDIVEHPSNETSTTLWRRSIMTGRLIRNRD